MTKEQFIKELSNYTQNLDKSGNIYFTDENNNRVSFKVNTITQTINKAKTCRDNANRWLNESNTNSEAYKQKVATVVGALSAPYTAKPISYIPYLDDIWQGRKLLFHKPFGEMTTKEYNAYGKLGKEYYKNHIQGKRVKNNVVGEIDFYGRQAAKPDPKYMEQYPFLRYNIKNAKENINIPVKKIKSKDGVEYTRKDATGFDNLKVKWKNTYYDYQIRNNPGLPNKDFYNIKPYEKLVEELLKQK